MKLTIINGTMKLTNCLSGTLSSSNTKRNLWLILKVFCLFVFVVEDCISELLFLLSFRGEEEGGVNS